MATGLTVLSVYLLFGMGIAFLVLSLPYSIMKFFALKIYHRERIYYVYQALYGTAIPESITIELNTTERNKLDQMVIKITQLPNTVSRKSVQSIVRKVCNYVPDWLLYLFAAIGSPATAHLAVYLCSTYGDDYFLGFFLFLGCLALSPVIVVVLKKITDSANKAANFEIEYHTDRLYEWITNKEEQNY